MKENRLFDTNDCIDFGQMKEEPFKWIYLLTTPYLIWLIEETDICFADLSLFYQFGNPLKIEEKSLTNVEKEKIFVSVKKNGKNNFSGNGQNYLLTVEIFSKLIEEKIIPANKFISYNFKFSQETIDINNKKLLNCNSNFNSINKERDNYLNKLFTK